MTSTKTKVTACLIVSFFIVEEIWQILKVTKYKDTIVNWWIFLDYPYSILWFFRDYGCYVSFLLHEIVIYRLTVKIKLLNDLARMYIIYRSFQVLIYQAHFDWFPAAVTLSGLMLLFAFFTIRTHKDNPDTVINYKAK